jgi:hypothetical protein
MELKERVIFPFPCASWFTCTFNPSFALSWFSMDRTTADFGVDLVAGDLGLLLLGFPHCSTSRTLS